MRSLLTEVGLCICVLLLLGFAPLSSSQPSGQYSVLYPYVQCCFHAGVRVSDCNGCIAGGPPTTIRAASSSSYTYHWPVPWSLWLRNTTAAAEFRLEKCFGVSWMQVQRGEPVGSNNPFNTSSVHEINVARFAIDHGNFWAKVHMAGPAKADLIVADKGEQCKRFTGVTDTHRPKSLLAGPLLPLLPPNISLTAEPYLDDEPPETDEEPMSILLSFDTHPEATGQEYRVYSALAPRGGTSGCGSAAPRHECITSTVCGTEHAMDALSSWSAFAPGQRHSILIPDLKQRQRRVFQIMTRDALDRKRVYRAVSAVPVYDQPRPVHSSRTIFMVSGGIATLTLLLILTLVVAKLRLDLTLVERVRERERRLEKRWDARLKRSEQASRSSTPRQPPVQPAAPPPRRRRASDETPPSIPSTEPASEPKKAHHKQPQQIDSPVTTPPRGGSEWDSKGVARQGSAAETRRQHSSVADPVARLESAHGATQMPFAVSEEASAVHGPDTVERGSHGIGRGPSLGRAGDPKVAWG